MVQTLIVFQSYSTFKKELRRLLCSSRSVERILLTLVYIKKDYDWKPILKSKYPFVYIYDFTAIREDMIKITARDGKYERLIA